MWSSLPIWNNHEDDIRNWMFPPNLCSWLPLIVDARRTQSVGPDRDDNDWG